MLSSKFNINLTKYLSVILYFNIILIAINDKMTIKLVILITVIYCISICNALECYVCNNQDNNRGKCQNTIKICEQEEDTCLTEVQWGSVPYWSEGAPKQYYISKKCTTKKKCEQMRHDSMPDCTYIWYQDWKCYDCCQGDRCNYYIISSANKYSLSSLSYVMTSTLILLLGPRLLT